MKNILLFILIIAPAIISIILLVYAMDKADNNNQKYIQCAFFSGMLIIISLMLGMFISLSMKINNTPTAIDVYRHKTALQITYKDSIPTDTIVIWNFIKENDKIKINE